MQFEIATLPVFAKIESRCLASTGFFARIAVVVLLIYYMVKSELYTTEETPMLPSFLWAERGSGKAAEDLRNGVLPGYCDDPSFNYIHSTRGWEYNDWICVAPSYGEMYQVNENQIFFLTSFSETTHNELPCTAFDTNSTLCMDPSGSIRNATREGGHCTCSLTYNYFAVGVESMQLGFLHGYQGSTTGIKGNALLINTRIVNYNGVEVKVANGSEVIGTVAEWLAWAGTDLDDYAKNTGVGDSDAESFTPPRTRVSGTVVSIDIKYEHRINYIQAYLHVHPSRDTWTSIENTVTYKQYPTLPTVDGVNVSRSTQLVYVDRSNRGIKIIITGGENIKSLSYSRLKTELAVLVVFVGLITTALGLIATNGHKFGFGFNGAIFRKQLLTSWGGDNETKAMKKFIRVYKRLFRKINGGSDKITREHWRAFALGVECDDFEEKRTWREICAELPDSTFSEKVDHVRVETLWMVINNEQQNLLDTKWKQWSEKAVRHRDSILRKITHSLQARTKVLEHNDDKNRKVVESTLKHWSQPERFVEHTLDTDKSK